MSDVYIPGGRKNYGFLRFFSERDAESAMRCNGMYLGEYRISVEMAGGEKRSSEEMASGKSQRPMGCGVYGEGNGMGNAMGCGPAGGCMGNAMGRCMGGMGGMGGCMAGGMPRHADMGRGPGGGGSQPERSTG